VDELKFKISFQEMHKHALSEDDKEFDRQFLSIIGSAIDKHFYSKVVGVTSTTATESTGKICSGSVKCLNSLICTANRKTRQTETRSTLPQRQGQNLAIWIVMRQPKLRVRITFHSL
jgi:hypothetical protein